MELAPHLDHGDEADRGEPLARGELVRLAYRLGRSHATGTLTVLARGDIVRGGPLVLRRGALVAAPADERATQARRRLARLAAAEAGRWWFDGGSAPYPPGASVTVPLAAWARQHLEAQLDGGRAEVLTGELAGRRLSLAPEQAPPADLLDEADRRVVAALAQPRRLDQLWTQARIPRFRLLSFLHFLRQVGALTVVEIGAHDSGPHRAAARGDSGPHARAAAAVAGAPPGAHAAALRVLGLAGPADRDTVKRAYRRLARALHPDLHPSADLARRRALEARLAEASAAAATLLGAPAAAS